jgi:hypothetical protein
VQHLCRRHRLFSVVGKKWGHFERDETIITRSPLMDGEKQVSSSCQVMQSELEEQLFSRLPCGGKLNNLIVVRFALRDGMLKDGRIPVTALPRALVAGNSGHRCAKEGQQTVPI